MNFCHLILQTCLRPYTMILYRYGFSETNNWVHLNMSNLCIYIEHRLEDRTWQHVYGLLQLLSTVYTTCLSARFQILLKSCLFSLCIRKLGTDLSTQILLRSVVLCVTIYCVMAMITMTSKHTGPPYLALFTFGRNSKYKSSSTFFLCGYYTLWFWMEIRPCYLWKPIAVYYGLYTPYSRFSLCLPTRAMARPFH